MSPRKSFSMVIWSKVSLSMKMYPVSSEYRYCISRLSRRARLTFSSARKVLSTTAPFLMLFSLVRTMAPPLPGLWCSYLMMLYSSPSRSRVWPGRMSLVEII
jgi:hypothetical protein